MQHRARAWFARFTNSRCSTRVVSYRRYTSQLYSRDTIRNLNLHTKFTWWALRSTTLHESVVGVFGVAESTLFTIDAIGVSITTFSDFPGEQEVILLPGTRLVVTNGAITVDNGCWEFEESVWEAAQKRLERCQKCEDGSKAVNSTGIAPSAVIPEQDDRGVPLFQHTDLPHPGWSEIMLSDKSSRLQSYSPSYAPHAFTKLLSSFSRLSTKFVEFVSICVVTHNSMH